MRNGIVAIVLVLASLTAGACGRATPVTSGEQPGASAEPPTQPSRDTDERDLGGRAVSVREELTGGLAALLARVDSTDGRFAKVEVTEVLTTGLDYERSTDCGERRQGEHLTIENATTGYENDLLPGDIALFVGTPCEDHRDGLRLTASSPNGRKVVDGTIDLGGGDIVTLDEARRLAGADWKPQAPLEHRPAVAVTPRPAK